MNTTLEDGILIIEAENEDELMLLLGWMDAEEKPIMVGCQATNLEEIKYDS